MRIVLFLFVLVFGVNCSAQELTIQAKETPRYNWKRAILPAGIDFFAGMAWGFHETSVHHADRFPEGWNSKFWDNRISWRNKYKNGDPLQGSKYFGSTSFLVWTTDAKHLFSTTHKGLLVGARLVIVLGEKKPFWHYLVDTCIGFVSYSVGFHTIYSLTFRE